MNKLFTKRFIILTIVMCILFAFPAFADEASFLDALQSEQAADQEAYNLRMEYMQDLIQQDAYSTRMDVYEGLEQNMALRQAIVDYALSYVGVTPYYPGGGSLIYGTDCSGFVCLIFGTFDIWLSLSSVAYQYSIGTHIAPEDRLPGDIIVYDNGAHVGIYAGYDYVVHCSSPENGTVCWPWNYRNITAVVRVL